MNRIITSCIVPFFNESAGVLGVLKSLSKVKNVDEVICVDDGSSDKTYLKIRRLYPRVKLIRLNKNQGKSKAVAAGLKTSHGRNILLFDADLAKIDIQKVQEVVGIFSRNPEVDMVLFRRLNDPLAFKLIRTDVVITGERLLKRRDLAKILKSKPIRFQLELAINDYMEKNGKKVYWFPLSTKNTFKSEKYGFSTGVVHEYRMIKNLFAYKNPFFLLYNLASFARERLAFEEK